MKNIFVFNFILKYSLLFVFTLISSAFFLSCEEENSVNDETGTEEEGLSAEDSTNIGISEWIYEVMDEVYYWTSEMPDYTDFSSKTDPESFYYDELVYDEEDKWSYITDDFTSLEAELSGVPVSMGYSPMFGLISENQVIIIVEFVYPDSPAETAGLKRGDIILTIDGEYMDTTNYYDLYSQTSYTVGLGYLNNSSILSSGETISMTATTIAADPLIYDTIFEVSGKKIGYFVYTEFVSGDNDEYLESIDNVFSNFTTAGVTDLIVDLRYNGGGEIDASTYLASSIAPASVANGSNVFVTYEYNDLYQSYFEYYHYDDYLETKFLNKVNDFEISSVSFLTTSGTASASELLITGLDPYMDVTIVGEPTYGKYTGMWVIYDTDHEPREHDWCLLPVVMKYANSEGYTDFDDGLTPDYEVTDYMLYAVPFGDIEDDLLATAIEQISGASIRSAKIDKRDYSIQLDQILNKKEDFRRNLYVPRSTSLNF